MGSVDVEAAVADAYRTQWAFVLAATIRVTGDIDEAEECVQDAFSKALTTWAASGVPQNPGAWITTVARRRAIDLLRRRTTHDRLLPMFIEPDHESTVIDTPTSPIADDRLRLIFTCCHPSLSFETQVALTLKLVCGLTTSEVARAFLVSESTMAARITRAKKKITTSHIPYRVPSQRELPPRIDAVLAVIHLVFATGHTAPSGADLMRRDLVERALDLARMLRALLPDQAGVAGLLALIVLSDARQRTRTSEDGTLLLISEQDRSQWDDAAIEEGLQLVREALQRGPTDRFALMAAIAAVHDQASTWASTDWMEIVRLYDTLEAVWPSPVVSLNRAVALGFANGPQVGLDALDDLQHDSVLDNYSYFASARADFLRRLGRADEAVAEYRRALESCDNDVERRFLSRRIAEITTEGKTDFLGEELIDDELFRHLK
jgi:RNA polymerase sigma-70 factor (ECF subfamily)